VSRFGWNRLVYASIAAAAEDEQRDDQNPNPVIAQKVAQTAVIHMKILRS
jgi:hypothetical protein